MNRHIMSELTGTLYHSHLIQGKVDSLLSIAYQCLAMPALPLVN